MKRIISFLLSIMLITVILMPTEVKAAESNQSAGLVSVSSGSLNVRSSNSTSSSVVASLGKGSYVTLISKTGSWWKVEYNKNKYGYCHSDYITAIEGNAATVKIQSGSLNVRSGAGTSYSVKDSLIKNETVVVLSTSGNWSRILYYGTKTGYVSSDYLSILGSGVSSTPSYAKVSLNVPSYKQTDSRWANVKIGSSGKTISQIGCATTGIAMIESYRTAQTIYPDAMSKKLSYTSTGSVYWPSNYIAVTSSSGYLSKIYEQLKRGKPVLIGATNSSGSQHWVVVTGFSGGNSLTASGFTINDPGSSSRTTLQQFLNAYPNFYKYFYYN